jgi:hypothetical protein
MLRWAEPLRAELGASAVDHELATGHAGSHVHVRKSGIVATSLLIGMCLAGCGGAARVPGDLASARWLILGPLPNRVAEGCPELDQDLLAGSGGEAAAAPREGQRAAGTVWRSVRSTGGRIDLLAALGGATNSVAYAYTEIRSARGGRVALKLGSDDGVKIWLNGKLVWANHTHRALRRDEEIGRASCRERV